MRRGFRPRESKGGDGVAVSVIVRGHMTWLNVLGRVEGFERADSEFTKAGSGIEGCSEAGEACSVKRVG